MDAAPYQKLHIRTQQAAEYLGLSASNLEKMRMRGDGPTYAKLGRVVIYALGDLDTWVKAHKRTSTLELSDTENPRQ
jgi:predicted DNA-binding transcriptional regulator AlpA